MQSPFALDGQPDRTVEKEEEKEKNAAQEPIRIEKGEERSLKGPR